jgi:peroxiredoxin
VQILGVSFDDPDENAAWAEEEGFSFELWSDDDKTLALYYGAASSESTMVASRVSKLLDDEGTLILEYVDVATGTHPEQVLSDCQALFGG